MQVDEGGVTVEAYSYDANGNRLTSTNSAGTFAATYDSQDRIETYGSIEYTFTLNGELLNKTDTATNESTDYVYDAMGNLREVTLPNGDVLEYLVDGQGRRVGKLFNGVLERAWIWRGQLQPVAELDGAGNVVARFVYPNGGNVPALVVTEAATYQLVRDKLGSVRRVVEVSTGIVMQTADYDSWGRAYAASAGIYPFAFGGGLYDKDTSLIRFGARDYDATVGRWTSKDPSGFGGGRNWFEYVGSQPVNRIDPRGRDWIDTGGGTGAGAGSSPISSTDFVPLDDPNGPLPAAAAPDSPVAAAAAVAASAALADGPLPVGDLIGLCILAYAITTTNQPPPEICPLVEENSYICVYQCPFSGKIETQRYWLDMWPTPANDICPTAISHY